MMNFFSKKPSMKCPKCGFPTLPKHTFCPKCGHALTEEAQQQVEEHNKAQRETWEEEFEVEKKKAQFDFDQKQEQQKSAEEQELRKIEHQQEMSDRDAQRSRDQQQFDFDLEQRKEELSDERSFKRDEHNQLMTDRDTQRSRDQQQLDFDLEQRKEELSDERSFKRDEHNQSMTDRDAQRNRDQQQFDFELQRAEKTADLDMSQQEKKFDFDLDQKRRDADDERGFRKDEHQQEMTDRNVQRNREQQQFDFDLKRAEKTAELEDKQREKKFDFDLEVQKQEKADEHVLRMEEHEMKMASHEQDMADREAQRRMEELKLKGSIAMQNMQAMMDAKRAARQDEFDAEERRLQTQKEMTAEQIMAAQIREMDAGAQAKFAESFSAGKDAAREREVAKEQAQIYEKMMGQMMDMAKTGMQTNADIAIGRIVEERQRGDEYREEAHRVQERIDKTQEQSLKYTAQVTSSEQSTQAPPTESPSPIPLNTLWLREHGFEGSFNELAGYLHNLGADISQDYDNQGNPIIVVEGINQAKVMEVLEKAGVKF